MNVIQNGSFEEFEAILKKILEQFQDRENEEYVEEMFDKINLFNETKNEIENYEKTINSHTRPLRLGFVGGFSTGKSSMINSLLGEEILGVKLEPATAQITELSYGEKFEILEVTQGEYSYLHYKEISLEDYQKSSTTRVNKNKNLSHYIIKHPSKNLSRFTIVDTPGFSSTSKEDDDLTKNWIETLDLLIWIFDANIVGGKDDYDKLKELGSSTKIIGVINKIDLKSTVVREKIRNEILNEEFLDDVFFYSSKKVLQEFTKSKSFIDTLENITTEIKYCAINSENFDINKNNSSEITFKTSTLIKPFNLVPPQTTCYSEYYDELINKINDVRENEINLILNQTLVNKHNDFRNLIKDDLFDYQEVFNGDVSTQTNEIKKTTGFLQKSEDIYKNLNTDFYDRLDARFEVFYTAFFDALGDLLFSKSIDKGLFSDDVYICMIDVDDDKVKDNLYEFISNEFQSFLESSFDIYENIINHSVYKEFSMIEEIRSDKYHIINTIVEGLINSSVDSIIGYQRNFESYKTEEFLHHKNFHKNNIDLVVPDELLKDSICKLLIADLIDASVKYDFSLKKEIEELEFKKSDTLKILSMIDILLNKIN